MAVTNHTIWRPLWRHHRILILTNRGASVAQMIIQSLSTFRQIGGKQVWDEDRSVRGNGEPLQALAPHQMVPRQHGLRRMMQHTDAAFRVPCTQRRLTECESIQGTVFLAAARSYRGMSGPQSLGNEVI